MSGGRFNVLSTWNNQVVLDRETGLLWEQAPFCSDTPNGCANFDFHQNALFHCNNRIVGNRLGWRLPTIQELLTLIDPSTAGLPAGHPFFGGLPPSEGILTADFWSATEFENNVDVSTFAWFANFFPGNASEFAQVDSKFSSIGHFVWCVRSGEAVNPQ